MKLVKLLANLGYGSRKEVDKLLRSGAVTNAADVPYKHKDDAEPDDVRVAGEPLDPIFPLVLVLNKPDGSSATTIFQTKPGTQSCGSAR
jgi:16S rRNA pseudouridine516 synthase